MKARVKAHGGQEKLCLSIGMIVKNEEAILEKCLQSLEPLRKAVPSELIIADTGSTDRTMEIAEKYADTLFQIPWSGDFGAARNETLDRAQGEWFFYIDADEVLDADCEALIHLLQSEEAKKYQTISMIRYEYADSTRKEFTTTYYMRIHRRIPGNRFARKIHETLIAYSPIVQLPTLVHHSGYQKEVFREKQLRNRPLLEQEPGPMTPRRLRELSDTYAFDIPWEADRKKELLYQAIEMESQDQSLGMYPSVYTSLANLCLALKEYAEAERIAKQYLNGRAGKPPLMSDMEINYILGLSLHNQDAFSRAVAPLKQYQALYEQYHAGKLCTEDAGSVTLASAGKGEWMLTNFLLAFGYAKLGEYQTARAYLDRTDRKLLLPTHWKLSAAVDVIYAAESGDVSRLWETCHWLQQLPSREPLVESLQLFAQNAGQLAPAFDRYFEEFPAPPKDPGVCRAQLQLISTLWDVSDKNLLEELFPLVCRYIRWDAQFCRLLLRREVCTPENRYLLPGEYAFMLDAEQALALYDRQDREGYFCALQALLKQYPERSREISVLLSPIDESREQERKNREEFESLAQAVKTAFYNALQDGKQEEAQEILSRYQQLNGDDPELAMMRIMMVQPQGGALS
ncbi:glycosyltransferase family 2 protein [Anaerotruncus sp. 1XD42-93]|uniref:glycosyltransferase family 2 protein n=1 Tax=Anaerotruncus sp. 1XD42-93 TaxID=2320853 RepID=UPI0014122829|nr:glycosyltransferase family 2 protein [Anaerotruncus sp. 1XD42-93]